MIKISWSWTLNVVNNGVVSLAEWCDKHLHPLTRVNSVNVLDEGLRIGGRGRQMNSKVNIRQTRRGLMCVENKRSTQLAQSQSVPSRPLLASLYRWPGVVTQHTTACCSMQVVGITLVKYHFTNITSLRVVQQKHSGLLFKHLILQATMLQRTPVPPRSKEEH
jgi:hypothetical protein